jgi:hypothetical protein
VSVCELDSTVSRRDSMAVSYENGNNSSIKDDEFLDHLNYYQIITKESLLQS